MNTVEWLEKLISFNTTSQLSNLEMIDCIADFLAQEKAQFFLNYNQSRDKANLFTIFPDKNGNIQDGIVLSGHSDVVPVNSQSWHTNPFEAVIQDGRLYGRGAADMKGFLASVLSHVSFIKAQELTKPIYIAISYDEEISCIGIPNLLQAIKQKGIKLKCCIIGEPTSMQLVISHKGHYTFICELYGKAAHSSLTPYGVNAIKYAAKLINYLDEIEEYLKNVQTDEQFDVAFSTISVGEIAGGTAPNIIPEYCQLKFDVRNLPDVSIEPVVAMINHYLEHDILPEMMKIDEHSRCVCRILDKVPAMPSTQYSYLIELVTKVLGDDSQKKVAFATEGGHFVKEGIPTVICGPGDIQQAHQSNEYIELLQLQKCDDFIEKLITALT